MTTTLDRSAPTRRSPLLAWLSVIAVACGSFAIVTTEMLPVGMLSLIGPDLGVTTGASGQLMTTATAMGFVSSLAVLLVAGRLDRRILLSGLAAVMLLGNLATALADSYPLLLAARVVAGASIGGFWAVGVSMAVRLVPAKSVPRASAIIFSGVAIASVLGVPVGTLLGNTWDWRVAFGAMAGLSLLVLIALALLLPPLPTEHAIRARDLTDLLRKPAIRYGLLSALLIVLGHFTAYTYVTPVLRDSAGIGEGTIVTLLLVYGAAGIVGNFTAGALAAGRLRGLLIGCAIVIAAATAAIPTLVTGTWSAVAALIVWGLGYGAAPVLLQLWTLRSAPGATEGISALYTAGFQAAIGGGAILGGLGVDLVGTAAPMWLGFALALAPVALILAAARVQPSASD